MMETTPVRHSRFWLYAPFVALLLLAAAWTGGWFYAAHRAEGIVAAWIEREAADGRVYTCARQSVGGYPFRIEIRCGSPSATLQQADGGPVVIQARDLLAVAQVYQPDLIIAEVTGPMTVKGPADDQNYVANWTLLQLSARGRPRAPERISIAVDGPKLDRAGPAAEPVARAKRLEFHLRKNAEADARNPAFDLVFRTVEAVLAGVPSLGERPIDAEALAVLKGPADFSPKPLRDRLRTWQAAGGRLELKSSRLQQGGSLAVANGDIGLSTEGRLDGAVNLTFVGLDQLASAVLGQGNVGRSSAGLLAGLAMLGRAELEGRRAIAVPLSFRDGRIFFGPIPVGQAPALY
jgi:hypothetical protein